MKKKRDFKPAIIGVTLWAVYILFFKIAPKITQDEIVIYFGYSVLTIINIGLIFYGQNIIKQLNRDYKFWNSLLFFFGPAALTILGLLPKIEIETRIIRLEPSQLANNINHLPDLTLGTDSPMLLESIRNDSFTLNYLIKNYGSTNKENTSLFPILAAYELNKRQELLSDETRDILNKFAKEKQKTSFDELLSSLSNLTPEEIAKTYY